MADRAFEWMAANPWSVTMLIVAAILLVGLIEQVPA